METPQENIENLCPDENSSLIMLQAFNVNLSGKNAREFIREISDNILIRAHGGRYKIDVKTDELIALIFTSRTELDEGVNPPGNLHEMSPMNTLKLILVYLLFGTAKVALKGDARKLGARYQLLIEQKIASYLFSLGKIYFAQRSALESLGTKSESITETCKILDKHLLLRIGAMFHRMFDFFGIYPLFNAAFLERDTFKIDLVSKGALFWKDGNKGLEENRNYWSFSEIFTGNEKDNCRKVICSFVKFLNKKFIPKLFETKGESQTEHEQELLDMFHFWMGCGMVAPRDSKVILSFTNPFPAIFLEEKREANCLNEGESPALIGIEEFPFSLAWNTNREDLLRVFRRDVKIEKNDSNEESKGVIKNWDGFEVDIPEDVLDSKVATQNLEQIIKSAIVLNDNEVLPHSERSSGSLAKKKYSEQIDHFLKDEITQGIPEVKLVDFQRFNVKILEDLEHFRVILRLPYFLPQSDMVTAVSFGEYLENPPSLIISTS